MTDDEWIAKNPCLLRMRRHVEVNTDPQRRCYNGCHAKSEIVATPWQALERGPDAAWGERRLKFWNELNDYAVSQRGRSAKTDYEVITE
jgi:hypothetical protein